MLKSKETITYKGRTVYQEPKAFAFTHSNICKIWKGQAHRVYNGERIELYPISGKAPGPVADTFDEILEYGKIIDFE